MFVVTKFFINFKEAFPCYTASLSASKVQKNTGETTAGHSDLVLLLN